MSYTPNEIYAIDDSSTEIIGVKELYKTRQMSEMYTPIQPFDTSIAFAEVDSNLFNKIIKIPYNMSSDSNKQNDWITYELPLAEVTYYGFNGATPMDTYKEGIDIQPYAAICDCSSSGIGYYMDKSGNKINSDKYTDSLRFIVDCSINEMLFKISLSGYTYEQIQSIKGTTDKIAASNIDFRDFCEDPSNYYISSYSINCYCWNESTQKWVSKSNIKPCHVYNDEADEGISGVSIKNNFAAVTLNSSYLVKYDICKFSTNGKNSTSRITNHYGQYCILSDNFNINLVPYGIMPGVGETEDYGWQAYYETNSMLFLEWHTGISNNLEYPDQKFSGYKIALYPLILGTYLYTYLASFGVYMVDTNADLNMYARKPRTLYLYKDTFLGKLKDGKAIGNFVDSNHIPAYKEWNRNSSTCVREYNEIVDEETWVIHENQIPTKTFFDDELCIDDSPIALWKIKDSIPYKDCFPDINFINGAPSFIWVIGGDESDIIPRKLCFPPLYPPRKEKKPKYKTFPIILYDYHETITIRKDVK